MEKASNKFAVWIALGRIISMLVIFCMPLVMTRFLSQADYGVFSQYFTLYSSLNVILALGIHANLFYFYPTAEGYEKDRYVTNTLVMLLGMSFIAFVLMSLPITRDLVFASSELRRYAGYVTVSIVLTIPMNMVSPLFTVREDKLAAVTFPGLIASLRVCTVVLAALISNDLRTIFQSLVIFQACVMLGIICYAMHQCRFLVDFTKMKKQLAYSIPFGMTVGLQLFSNYFDKIASIRFLDSAEYAIYGVAFMSIPGISQIYDSLCQVNMVNMTRSYQRGSMSGVVSLYKDFVIKTLSFSTPIILAVSLYSEEIIGLLYPASYAAAAKFFRIYSLTFLIGMLGAGTILRSINKTRHSFLSFLIACMIGLPIAYYLISRYGINGAIIGAVINIVLPRITQICFEVHDTGVPLFSYLPWKQMGMIFLIALIGLIPMLIIKGFLHPGLLWCIFMSGIYVLGAYHFYVRNDIFTVDRAFIMKYVNRIVKKKKA